MKILIVIPARGGSKGIPRKNLRLLNGKPLIYYSIKTALHSIFSPDVYVSSDDDEILLMSKNFGAKTFKRNQKNAEDHTTLDPVIYECYKFAEKKENKTYDCVVTLQPTSPLLKTSTLDQSLEYFIRNKKTTDTLISVKDNTHLSWRKEGNNFIPNYIKRVNRQVLPKEYTETGGFLISQSSNVEMDNRIGKKISLSILENGEEIDIDNYVDWNICQYFLSKKKILFVVTGNNKVGLGHVYNTLIIANDILNHSIEFLVDKASELALQKIKTFNYPCYIQKSNNLINDIREREPNLIINDLLDTSVKYMEQIKSLDVQVINFEDLGPGSLMADSVFNAIYPEKIEVENHYYGQNYFILRDEFFYHENEKKIEEVKEILITFGGVDPNNYTKKVLLSIYDYCKKNNILIHVIAGFGYQNYDSLDAFKDVLVHKNISNISEYMFRCDLIFTSAGRTIYEIASIGSPAIVMAQNKRETTHFFATEKFGFLNLGIGTLISEATILDYFIELIHNKDKRIAMNEKMKKNKLKQGRKTVNKIIQNIL